MSAADSMAADMVRIEANFDVNTVHDWTFPPPGYLHFPALSLPEARVRIRCGPALRKPVPNAVMKLGRLAGLEHLEAEWNVPALLWNEIVSVVSGGGAGIAVVGMPTLEDLLGGWTEGSFLAAASCLTSKLLAQAACYPLLRVNKMLVDLPSPDRWDEEDHQLLDVQVLLIPDLSLDCGLWGDGSSVAWWKIAHLLRWRYQQGLQTVAGIQNLGKLHPSVREIVLGAYNVMAMPHTPPHACDAIAHAEARYEVPNGSTTLSKMKLNKDVANLVVHWGLVGT